MIDLELPPEVLEEAEEEGPLLVDSSLDIRKWGNDDPRWRWANPERKVRGKTNNPVLFGKIFYVAQKEVLKIRKKVEYKEMRRFFRSLWKMCSEASFSGKDCSKRMHDELMKALDKWG